MAHLGWCATETPLSVAHPPPCATESCVSVAHLPRCATEFGQIRLRSIIEGGPRQYSVAHLGWCATETLLFVAHPAWCAIEICLSVAHGQKLRHRKAENSVAHLTPCATEIFLWRTVKRCATECEPPYNPFPSSVSPRVFNEGDLVLRLVQRSKGRHKLSAPWEGPFIVSKALHNDSYYLIDAQDARKDGLDRRGQETKRPWNVALLRPFYS